MNQLIVPNEAQLSDTENSSYGDLENTQPLPQGEIAETEYSGTMMQPAVYTGDDSGFYEQNYNQFMPMHYGVSPDQNVKVCENVISIAGIKGGVGKTTVAKELATALSMAVVNGKRLNVCLVDCDVEFGDVSSVIRINDTSDISNLLVDIANVLANYGDFYGYRMIDQYYPIENYMSTYESGLKVISAPRVQGHNNFISYDVMTAVVEKVKRAGFDFIILDTAGNNYEYTIAAHQLASQLFLVTTLEYSAINSMNQMLQYFAQMGIPMDKMHLVVNKSLGNRKKDGISAEEVVAFLRFFGDTTVLPFVSDICLSNNLGRPEVMNKNSKYAKSIFELVRKVLAKRKDE